MKAESCHCPVCGYGHGPVELVCWDCRGKGAKRTPGRAPHRERASGWRCSECGARFSGLTAFDMHRIGAFGVPYTRRCRTPQEMTERGLVQNDGVWGQPRMALKPDGVRTA